MNSHEGHFLVAAPHALDSNFAGTVILVIEHSDKGAIGVILNCPKKQSACAHRKNSSERLSTAQFFSGGPITGPVMAVHAKAALGERQLVPGVFFSMEEQNVWKLMRHAEKPLLIFYGYAGWGADNSSTKSSRAPWRVLPATREQVFSGDGDLWEQLSTQASRQQLHMMFKMKHIPADPLLN